MAIYVDNFPVREEAARALRDIPSWSSNQLPSLPGVWEFKEADHCSRCWMTRMISSSFRGINNIKNGTIPQLSVASLII